ncbi:MAG TPA: uracil-DNA glycosylase [Terriglobales bacterium]|jgi:uracil-DNA glycosylase family 4|nr:uracil-DNA glycosylase [Terriglobales bacterium]
MSLTLSPELRHAVAERIRFYNELGVYDFYRRAVTQTTGADFQDQQPELGDEMNPRKATAAAPPVAVEESILAVTASRPEQGVSDPAQALKLIREDLGDCKRCPLHKQGRKQIVFGVGNPNAELLFVGEGPGADEDEQGEPFVGRSGQLLTNMIKAMGLSREQVYIANIVKCRPPANRAPEREESETCSPFLMRQIAAIKPKVVVALGATAAKGLLAMSAPMTQLRGRFYDFKPPGVRDPDWDGCKLAVTYHPAFLLRDPRQKGEAWKDLQMVMRELGLKAPKATS